MLDFRIETFITVCEFMNFTKAAHHLHITQPSVSQHIRYLEDYFGTELFYYHKRKLMLTDAGKEILAACITFTNDQKKLMNHIKQLSHHTKKVVFGATLTIGEYILPAYLADYTKKNKDLSFTFCIQDTSKLLKKLDKGDIDFAFIEGYFPKDRYDYISFSKERLLPICSSSHPILEKQDVKLKDLFALPLILREKGSGTRDTLEHFLACENSSIKDFKSTIEVGGMEAIKTLVSLETGITFLYESAISHELHDKKLAIIPLQQHFDNEFSFIWRKDSIYSDEYTSFFHELMPY